MSTRFYNDKRSAVAMVSISVYWKRRAMENRILDEYVTGILAQREKFTFASRPSGKSKNWRKKKWFEKAISLSFFSLALEFIIKLSSLRFRFNTRGFEFDLSVGVVSSRQRLSPIASSPRFRKRTTFFSLPLYYNKNLTL